MKITPELEAVAKAIYWSDPRTQQPPISSYPWEKQNETTREAYRAMARAALMAIREPSEGMLDAVVNADDDGSGEWEASWQAAIDHVLGGNT